MLSQIRNSQAIQTSLLVFGIVVIIVSSLTYTNEHFDWSGVLVESWGLLFDAFIFGLVIVWIEEGRKKRSNIERWLEDIDDYRGWKEEEARYRIRGLIKRVQKERSGLSGINLSFLNLYRIDLSNAKLRGADLKGADLRGANLRGADLRGVDLGSANLIGAELSKADLRDANLNGANLSRADFRGVFNWKRTRSIKNADIGEVLAPEGFVEWASSNGAIFNSPDLDPPNE